MANPKDFGAVGDGSTDDTEALEHALEAGDGALELEKGTFRVTRSLVLDLARQGYGAVIGKGGASRIVMAGPGPAIRVVGNHRGTARPDSVAEPTWRDERMPTIRDVEFLGEHPEAVGVELRRTMQCVVSRVLVRRCRYGIHLVERNRNFVLADSHLYDNAEYGLFFDCCNLHQVNVHGNHISYNKRAGIMSLDGDVHNVQIVGNDIEYNNRPGAKPSDEGPQAADIWLQAPEGVVSEVAISGNTIQATVEPGGANVRIRGSREDSPRGARLIAITGNILGSQERGVELEDAQRVALTGNTIYSSREFSLLARRCSGVTVAGNTFVWRGLEDDPPEDGVWLEDCENVALTGLATQRLCSGSAERGGAFTLIRCRDCAVSGCQILDPLHRGVELESCRRCRVSDNTILDRRERPSMRHAIRLSGACRDNLVQNNLLGGAVDRPLSGAGATFQGNVVEGS